MAVNPVEIDTAALAKPIGRAARIRIGGTVYEARCPKDAVLARIQEQGTGTVSALVDIMGAMLGAEAGAEVAAMLDDPDNDEVSIVTLSAVVTFLMDDPAGPQWGQELTDNLKSLGSGETPRTVPVRRSPGAAPRKAVKRTPARR